MASRHTVVRMSFLLMLGWCILCWPVSVRAQKTDPQSELEFGRSISLDLRKYGSISHNQAMNERVQRVGMALVSKMESRLFPYEFHVYASPDINAWAAPGGIIVIYEGLLSMLQDDDMLAMALGHELGHATHRDWANTADKMKIVNLLALSVSVAAKDREGYFASCISTLSYLHYSRVDERKADTYGTELAWLAGYDPQGGSKLMQIFVEMDEGSRSIPRYLRSHPESKSRLAKIQAECKELSTRIRPVGDANTPQETQPALEELVGDLGGLVPTATPWYPLAVGNCWEYVVEGPDSRSSYLLRVAGGIPTENGWIFRLETAIGKTIVTSQVLTTANGIWRRGRIASPESPWRLETLFDVGGTITSIDEEPYTLIGLEELTVPCGRFPNARHIRKTTKNPQMTIDLWFAEGVGLVKRSCAETGVSEILVRFTIPTPVELGKR